MGAAKDPARIIGRTACFLGDNPAAHVKQSPGKLPYVYCPVCGFTAATRNGNQGAMLMAMARPEKHADLVAAPPAPAAAPLTVATPPAAPAPEPKPAIKKRSMWAPLLGAAS